MNEVSQAREQLDRDLLALEQALTPERLYERVISSARGFYLDDTGGVKVKNLAITAGVLVAFVAIRKIF